MLKFKQHITEISAQKTQKYLDRAMGDHAHQNMARRNTQGAASAEYARKEALRKKGISRAIGRLYPQNEETLNELSKDTLNSYHWAARADRNKTDDKINAGMAKQNKEWSARRHQNITKQLEKSQKRTQGILRALGKLQKEEKELDEATYQGKKVPLNKPMAGDVKKSKVYVDPDGDGKAKKVNFGDKNMTIKKNIPARRKSFRARHNCENPGPKDKARYWSCKAW